MPVVQVPPEILRIGHPAPVSVRDAAGHLLLAKGVLIASEEQRSRLVARAIYVDELDGDLLNRALAGKLDSMLRQNARLGQIAQARVDGAVIATGTPGSKESVDPTVAWANLQMRGRVLLQDPAPADFLPRLLKLQREVLDLVEADADAALLILVQATTSDAHHYSVFHSLLVAVLCELAARQLPSFTPAWRDSLRCAALTMNMAMTALQDQLALQEEAPSTRQRAMIDKHAARGAACLREAGVADALWLEAVEHHHTTSAGPLAAQSPGLQLARLLQRADIFSARLSMRRARPALAASAAVKAAYLDEHQQADEAGKAIIQTTGIYPPGSYVRLGNGEVAVVLRRGPHAKAPKVASIVSKSGTVLVEPVVRDTRVNPHDVTGGVAPHEVRVRLNMERLLKLA
ncbi:MAG TPA: phosphohydrolase [Rhizobacter sp.]|nr:phosphohydrolase [Rhizobacter sp.]